MGRDAMDELKLEQIEELRLDLESLRRHLEQSLQASEQGARPVDLDQPIGRVTRMDAIQQQSMAQAGRRAIEMRLRQVKAALASLGSGSYGFCRHCEEPIGYSRLKVRPESPFCVDCQKRVESRS